MLLYIVGFVTVTVAVPNVDVDVVVTDVINAKKFEVQSKAESRLEFLMFTFSYLIKI